MVTAGIPTVSGVSFSLEHPSYRSPAQCATGAEMGSGKVIRILGRYAAALPLCGLALSP